MAGRGNTRMLALLIGLVLVMTGLAFASVPLYRLFCQATGFDGTTQVAKQAPGAAVGRTILVRFNADVAPGLPWSFEPVQPFVRVHAGEPVLAAFRATNHADHPITGRATYNVTPLTTGIYFNKIECFCFNEQSLGPGETAELPVTFFVDPAMLKDKDTREIDAITLSYTFFQAKNPPKPVAPQLGALSPGTPSVSNRP